MKERGKAFENLSPLFFILPLTDERGNIPADIPIDLIIKFQISDQYKPTEE